jgi:hypothetical protein
VLLFKITFTNGTVSPEAVVVTVPVIVVWAKLIAESNNAKPMKSCFIVFRF